MVVVDLRTGRPVKEQILATVGEGPVHLSEVQGSLGLTNDTLSRCLLKLLREGEVALIPDDTGVLVTRPD
jgi:DNA-binding IclR family transcriptional regulator